MNDNLLLAIETLNNEKHELLNSREYRLGKTIFEYSNLLKSFKIKKIAERLKLKRAKLNIDKKYKKRVIGFDKEYNNGADYKSKRIVLYYCVTGDYDNIPYPLITFPNVTFCIFTDLPETYQMYSDVFVIKKIPKSILSKGSIMANRYIKFHPQEFFSDFDYSIYLDGNVRVIADVRKFVTKCNGKTGIAMHQHRSRSCIYDEAIACKLLQRGNKYNIDAQITRYMCQGMPKQFGMNEATIIVSDLKNENSVSLLNCWWDEFVDSNSLRDQLAWPYVLWINGYSITDVGVLGEDIYKNNKVELVMHN